MAAMGFTANSTLDASAPPVSVSCGPLGHWDDWEDWGVAGVPRATGSRPLPFSKPRMRTGLGKS